MTRRWVWTACGLFSACSGEPLLLGDDPNFLWYSDVESGDVSDWTSAGHTWENAEGELDIVSSPTRSGSHAVRARVLTQPPGTQSAAMLVLERDREEAFYSAWFYVPEIPDPSFYWVFFKLGGPEGLGVPVDVWAFNLDVAGPEELSLRPFSPHHDTPLLEAVTIQPRRWFHVEAQLRTSAADDGLVRLWIDGRRVFEFTGRMDPEMGTLWTIGSGSEELADGDAALIIDDAAVTQRRLGPDHDPFWQ